MNCNCLDGDFGDRDVDADVEEDVVEIVGHEVTAPVVVAVVDAAVAVVDAAAVVGGRVTSHDEDASSGEVVHEHRGHVHVLSGLLSGW